MIEPLVFVVFGRAQGKGSKRVLPIRGRKSSRVVLVDSNRNAAPWAEAVAAKAAEAMVANDVSLIRSGVAVELTFFFARPKSHYGTGRNSGKVRDSAPRHMVTMPDVDHLVRCAGDALTGIVIGDDAQIVELVAGKYYGAPERLEVRVREVKDER